MKAKLLSTVFFLAVLSNTAFCQKIHVGFKAGADLHKLEGKSFDEEFKFGYHIGAYVEIKVKKIGIQPELYFSQVNAQSNKNGSVFSPTVNDVKKIKFSYLNVPILANIYFNPHVALQLGPQFGILVNQDASLAGNTQDAFKKGDFSLTGGLQIKILKFRIYGRYVIGLNDKNDIKTATNDETWKSQTAHIGIGYTIL